MAIFALLPWKFAKRSWELSFQQRHLRFIESKIPMLVLVACPFSLWEFQELKVNPVVSLQLAVVFSALSLLYLNTLDSRESRNDDRPLVKWTGRMLVASTCLKAITVSKELDHLEWGLRYFVLSGLCILTFEELLVWSLSGLAVLVVHRTQAYMLMPPLQALLAVLKAQEFPASPATPPSNETQLDVLFMLVVLLPLLHLITMYVVFGSRRAEWSRALATCTCFVESAKKGKGKNADRIGGKSPLSSNRETIGSNASSRSEQPNSLSLSATSDLGVSLEEQENLMHDDYFTREEWRGLEEQVESEGAEMVSRAAYCTSNHGSYHWIHSNKVLGEGSYGVVRLVKNKSSGALCAMKMEKSRPRSAKHKARAAKGGGEADSEIMLLQMLEHPHVVALVDYVALEDGTLLVMEWCGGGSIERILSSFGPLDLPAAQWFTSNLVSALSYLHRHAVSHADLKPSNCLLAIQGEAVLLKLADFGTGEYKASGRRSKIVGTPLYVAPEVRNMKASRRKMDVWALGVCTLELLSGRTLPLPGGRGAASPPEVVKHITSLSADPPLPSDFPPGPPSDFVQSCLRLDPALRPTLPTLARHPFIASASTCPPPAVSPSIASLLSRPAVNPSRLVYADMMLLPRIHRTLAIFVFNPTAIWQWLLELEEPFVNPDREKLFAYYMKADPVFLPVLRVAMPLYWGMNVPVIYAVYKIVPVLALVKLALLSVIAASFFLNPQQRLNYWHYTLQILRVGLVIRCFVKVVTNIIWTPIYFFILFIGTSPLMPTVAEMILWHLIFLVQIVTHVFLEACAHVQLSGATSLKDLPPLVIDNVISSLLIIGACFSLSVHSCLHVRKERRHYFRKHFYSLNLPGVASAAESKTKAKSRSSTQASASDGGPESNSGSEPSLKPSRGPTESSSGSAAGKPKPATTDSGPPAGHVGGDRNAPGSAAGLSGFSSARPTGSSSQGDTSSTLVAPSRGKD